MCRGTFIYTPDSEQSAGRRELTVNQSALSCSQLEAIKKTDGIFDNAEVNNWAVFYTFALNRLWDFSFNVPKKSLIFHKNIAKVEFGHSYFREEEDKSA